MSVPVECAIFVVLGVCVCVSIPGAEVFFRSPETDSERNANCSGMQPCFLVSFQIYKQNIIAYVYMLIQQTK